VRVGSAVVATIARLTASAAPCVAGVESVTAVVGDGTVALGMGVCCDSRADPERVAATVRRDLIDRVEGMTGLVVAEARVTVSVARCEEAPPLAGPVGRPDGTGYAAAILGCDGVAALAGRQPVDIGASELAVHIVARWTTSLPAVARQVSTAVAPLARGRRVVVHVDGLDVPTLVPACLLP
jgi:hypothetical protein